MGKSSIAKHLGVGPGSPYARLLGAEVRRLRISRGLTQAALGAPLTRGYISALEHGHAGASVGTLLLLADRLEITPDVLLALVNEQLPVALHSEHENEHASHDPGGSHPRQTDRGTAA